MRLDQTVEEAHRAAPYLRRVGLDEALDAVNQQFAHPAGFDGVATAGNVSERAAAIATANPSVTNFFHAAVLD